MIHPRRTAHGKTIGKHETLTKKTRDQPFHAGIRRIAAMATRQIVDPEVVPFPTWKDSVAVS
jgi:hypothetical protein